MPGERVARVRACAKINLSLRVLGVRPDGYHELRTILQSIALHDTLTIRAVRGPFRLTCDDPRCPSDETNLVWRAADRLWAAAGRRGSPQDISIDLAKRIPMQAGLGGGSSDAAAALRALGRIWRVDEARQRATAAALGADVPYFFEGGTVLGLERGDLLFPLIDHPAGWVVLALPPFGVSTRDAFAWWDQIDGGRALKASRPRPAAGLALRRRKNQPLAELRNDLQSVVVAHHPQITRLIGALRRAGAAHAGMSGSGSAVFGLFARRTEATRAAGVVGSRPAGTVVMVTRTLNRPGYQALAAVSGHRLNLPFAPRGSGHV
jgi:4-diphosphocytidyl-2-C-methyl-D-erythritol kinase